MSNDNNPGTTENALIDINLIKQAIIKYFNFPNGVLPNEKQFSIRYLGMDDFNNYVTLFLKAQNYPESQRSDYTPGNIPPAFSDSTALESVIYIFNDSPDFKPNGNIDLNFYKSTVCHECCHAVSNGRTGFVSESKTGFNWDEAATDYFGEQVSHIAFGDAFPFRSNYYCNDLVFYLPLRDQFGVVFNKDMNILKDFYINGNEEGNSFSHFLDEQNFKDGKSRRQYADDVLFNEGDENIQKEKNAVKAIQKSVDGSSSRLKLKITEINTTLAKYNIAPIDVENVTMPAARAFGLSRREDFISLYEAAYPGADMTNLPAAFRKGNIIIAYDKGDRPNNQELRNTVSTAAVEAIIEAHLHKTGQAWVSQDPVRLRQLSALLAAEITPTLSTKAVSLSTKQPSGVEIELHNFKEYLKSQNINFDDKPAFGAELTKNSAPVGWKTDVSPDLTKTGIYTDDTQYKNQIIIELSDNHTGGSVNDAAGYLFAKHSGKTEWLKYNPATKSLEFVKGTTVELPPESRIIIVGYGDVATSTLGGLSASDLANVIGTKFGASNSVMRVSLVGCNVGQNSDYAGSLLLALNRNSKTVTDGVTARSSLVRVDDKGQKWVANIDPSTNSVKEWINGNDGSSKIKVTLDAQGQVNSAPVVNEDGELKRVDQFEPNSVSGELDKLRAMGLEGLSDVRIANIKYKVALLNAMGLVGENGRVSEQDIYALQSANGDIDPSKLCFDENIFGQFFSESHDSVTLHNAALLTNVILSTNQNDTSKMFIGGNSLDSDSLAGSYTAAIKEMNAGWPGSDVFSAQLRDIYASYQQQSLLRQFEEKFSVSSSDADMVSSLQRYAEQLVGVTADDLNTLRLRFPTLSDAQLIEKVAIDAAKRSLRGNTEAEDALNVGRWTASDADIFLSAHGIVSKSSDGPVINADALHRLINQGSALEHIRLIAALELTDPYVAKTAVSALHESSEPTIKDLGSVLSDKFTSAGSRNTEAISSYGGDALAVFMTLTSIQQTIMNWSKLSSAQRGLDVTAIVGGFGTTSVASKAISSIFAQAGAALGDVGEAVKGSVLGLALAPVTFAAIGLQWQDFWDNGGDTSSLSYRSLVASTVITTVTTAAGLALTGVSIAASLGAVAATSILGAIAASAGPIGVVIGAATFLINGIVQGAMQIAQYDQDFDNVGDKVEQFFAAWIGIQTDGFLRAQARHDGKIAAEEQKQSLTEQWEKTKKYLSDIFSKDGYKYLTVCERTYTVTPAVVRTTGDTYSYLLQASETYAESLPAITSDNIDTDNSVWSELGSHPALKLQGLPNIQHMFNLNDETKLDTLTGGNKTNVFNLSRDAQISALIGGEGDDTLMWQAGNVRAPNHIMSVFINTNTGEAYARDTESLQVNAYIQKFSVSNIDNFSIATTGEVEIHANDAKNHILEAIATRGRLFGGTGTNTFVLNDQTFAYSISNDLFLWKENATAYIELTPDATRAAMADASQLLSSSNDKQAAFIELPFSYADMSICREGYSLKLFSPSGNTLTVDNVFDLTGDWNKKKVTQLRDRDSREFSLNILGLPQSSGTTTPLASIPKAFVFRNSGATDRSSSNIEYLHGDGSSNSYSFENASGHFIVKPRTSQHMTLLLDIDITEIYYSHEGDGSLILIRQSGDSILSITIENYSGVSDQLSFYAKIQKESATTGTESAFEKLVLPVRGGGILGVSNILASDIKDHGLKFPADETPNKYINLSQDAVNHWVVDAVSASGLNIQIAGHLNYLRKGNDLIMYDDQKLDHTYGLHATTYLKVREFFNGFITAPILNINHDTVTGETIKARTTTFQGTIVDGNIRLPDTITNFIGENGAGQYDINMSITQAYTVDNMADDGLYDSLQLHGVNDIAELTIEASESDIIIKNTMASVILKGYSKDAYRRHIFLRVRGGGSAPYVIPVRTWNNIDYYEVPPQVAGQQVHIFDSGKGNIIDIGNGAGPDTVTVSLPLDINNYTKTVIGNDLKLTGPGEGAFIYLANYYDFPKATLITWNNQGDDEIAVLPDNWHQDLLDAGVPRDWVVRYVNAGVNTVENARTVLAYQNNTYLKKIPDAQINPEMQRGVAITAFIPLSIPSFGNIGIATIYGNRPDGAGTGFDFSIDNGGNLVLRANAIDQTYYNQILKESFVKPGEKTALLFTYIPRDNNVYVWKQGYNVPLFVRGLGDTFNQAWRQGTGFYSNSGSNVIGCYIGNPREISESVGASFTTSDVNGLTGPTSLEVAKSIYRVEGVPGLTNELITELVDNEKLTSMEQINECVAYLNRGVLDAKLIRELIDDVHDPILATDIDIDLVNGLFKENASSEFTFNAAKENLDITSALVYLKCGVQAEEIRVIRKLLEDKGTAPQSIMEKTLIIQGYNKATAQLLSPILAQCGLRKETQASMFISGGYSNTDLVVKYVNAGVSIEELLNGNSVRNNYSSGDRRKLISVSVSDSLTQKVFSPRYYLTKDYTDSANYTLKAGRILDAGALRGTDNIYDVSIIKVQDGDGMLSQFRGNATPSNLVDGKEGRDKNGMDVKDEEFDAWAWSWVSPLDADGNVQKLSLPNGDDPLSAGWIKFDLKDKIALTNIILKGKGGDGTTMTLKAQFMDVNGEWKNASPGFSWTPGDRSSCRIDLNNIDLPYATYRISFQQGDLPTNFWLTEIDFSSKSLA
jgi:hypothetical protein